MAKQPRIPSYRFHKASGQAVVVLDGRSVYLGKWHTPESHGAYERVIGEWLANGRCLPGVSTPPTNTPLGGDSKTWLVNQIILAFWEHAKKHYRHPDGKPTRELDNLRDALRPVRRLYGQNPANEFGPLALRVIQQEMMKADLCRTVINARIKRIRRVFRWAASMELLPVAVAQALATVPPLLRGRCDARESSGVRPVDWQDVEATLPHLPRPVAAMVQVMRYSNCRAEDAVLMRGCDLTMKGDVWEYRPASHKNQWREESSPIHKRLVFLGPRCQEILRPFFKPDLQAYLFSPRESRADYDAKRAAERTTKKSPSEACRKRKPNPKRAPGNHYTVNTFQQSIRQTCRKLGLPAWCVLQVRHSRATDVRHGYGLEGAAASLGDSVEAALIYAERNQHLAKKIASEIG